MELGKLHVLLVHFPIALALAAALADVILIFRRKDFFRHAGFYCLILAAVAAIPTVVTGELRFGAIHLDPNMHDIAETHEGLAIAALCVLISAGAFRSVFRNRLRGRFLAAYAVMMVAVVVLVTLTGHWGGMLAFGPDYLQGLL